MTKPETAVVAPTTLLPTAANVLKSECPAHKHFVTWCAAKGAEPTKRQGRKFLQEFPRYRG